MGKRGMIEPHKGDKRYVRRGVQGEFTEAFLLRADEVIE
jgi:hypothetical protein